MPPLATPGDVPVPAVTTRLPDGRWNALEIAFWLIPVACFFLLPWMVRRMGIFTVSMFSDFRHFLR